MQIEWFVYHKNSVLGPFSTEDVNFQLADGKFDNQSFIWWKGEKDWIAISDWQNDYPKIINRLESHYNMSWKIKTPDMVTPALPFDGCIDFLKSVDIKSGIYICKDNTLEQWENIFTNSIFMNALEMTRRKFPRVPVVATAKVTKPGSKFSYLIKLNVIGEGGIGVSGLTKNFTVGTKVEVRIESPNFTSTLYAEGVVVYHTKDGVSGIEFEVLSAEVRASIAEYVNQFAGSRSDAAKAA